MDKTPLVIIGSGPAGLSAAIYTARAGIDTLVLGCAPKVSGDYDIDNYFGFPETISGEDLLERGRKQAARFGAQISCERVLNVHLENNAPMGGIGASPEPKFRITTEDREIEACGLILATGVSRIRPGIENLDDYDGKGVSYCVSCDGFFFRDRKVLVVGEAIFAANQALELLNYTPNVTVITQGKEPAMTPEFRERLADAGIPVLTKRIKRIEGDPAMERVVFDDEEEMTAEGLFVAIGEASSLDFAYTLGLERSGVFIVADHDQKTNVPGVFAAGDCVGRFLQIAVAVGEGARAGRSAIEHVKKTCRKKAKTE